MTQEGFLEAGRRIAATVVAILKPLSRRRRDAFRLDLSGLDLTDLYFRTLQPAIGNLALTSVDVSGNRLTALPEAIGNLAHLHSLDVSGNQLTALPKTIGNLTSLLSLDVSGNQLTTLPREISNLTALRWLRLDGNQLITLPVRSASSPRVIRSTCRATGFTHCPPRSKTSPP